MPWPWSEVRLDCLKAKERLAEDRYTDKWGRSSDLALVADAEGEQEDISVEGEEKHDTLIANDRPIDRLFTISQRSASEIKQQEFSK